MEKINYINNIIKNCDAINSLQLVSEIKTEKIVFSTSLGYEDQVITDIIFNNNLNISVFTLDTGRLFPETYSLLSATNLKYKKNIQVYFPNTNLVEEFTSKKGINSFYESIDNRKECCHIRKIEPLKRALKEYTIWVTGIRAQQSGNRNNMPILEWDETNNILKFHPLINWSLEDVENYIHKNNVPFNPLHTKGFVSIGCQPCTRAIKEGEDFRAGRWWWEDATKKECGLHN